MKAPLTHKPYAYKRKLVKSREENVYHILLQLKHSHFNKETNI